VASSAPRLRRDKLRRHFFWQLVDEVQPAQQFGHGVRRVVHLEAAPHEGTHGFRRHIKTAVEFRSQCRKLFLVDGGVGTLVVQPFEPGDAGRMVEPTVFADRLGVDE
jgi:hypothetical protein